MGLNRLQIQIFQKMSSDLNLEMEDYLQRFSKEYLQRVIKTLEELSEEEADTWITKAYLKSLG